MAEPIVASIVQWIGSLVLREANTLFKVVDQVKGLQQELELMQEYLQDADTKQEEGVQTLVRQIRMLAYEAEDVIDTYILKFPAQAEKARFVRYAHLLYNAHDIHKVAKEIHAIQSNVQRMAEKLNGWGVRRIVPSLQKCFQPSYPFEENNNEYLVGLERDVSKLLQVLMGEGNTHINILSIVGMGGSGKTTIARRLFNHPYSKECYNCTAWVYISQEWSIQHILSEILRKVGGDSHRETYELHAKLSREELVEKLRDTLKGKSYLVVLDDVWRREAIEEILPALPFEDINKGSKIIITTRNRDIIHFKKFQHSLFVHEPQPLNEEEGWQLFSKLALSHCTDYNVDNFKSLGKVMLNNCRGLPLAIVALAGYLKTRSSIGEWQQVSEVVKTKVLKGLHSNTHDSVQNLLALSYDDLSYNLKLCFLYLGVFPEDCQIPAGMLTRMWIAEGLVTAHEGMSPEDVAKEYLEELSHRFMIQVVRTNFKGTIKAFQLHDLLRDLCLKKAKEQSFLQIYAADSNQATRSLSISPRRVALHSSISFPTTNSNLRSLVLLTRSSIQHSAYDSMEMLDLKIVHHNFKLLRLLNLWGIQTNNGTLPEKIGSLIHLRYLGLRASNITALPSSIGNLRNLLTLDYRNIKSDKEVHVKIPNVLWQLLLLRHLFLPIEYPCTVGDLRLSALKNLQTLWGVRYYEWGTSFSKEMRKLSTTVRKLKVSVSTEKNLLAAFDCPSLISDRLHTFHCEWKGEISLRNVNAISHNQLLHKLVLVGKIEVNELSVIFPSNLVILELRDSILKDEDPLMAAGKLRHLKFLRLSNAYVGAIVSCASTSFPVLEELYLDNLPILIRWDKKNGAMPCLKKVMFTKCRMLRDFPKGLPFVANLHEKESGWSKPALRLPHNFEAIIVQCDSVVDTSSVNKLHEQLINGVFLNGRSQRFWVDMHNDTYQNCFMLYAKRLSYYHHHLQNFDSPFGMFHTDESEGFNEWTESRYSEVSPIITISDWFELQAQIDISFLSPDVTYEISFMVMIPQSAEGCIGSASSLCYLLPPKNIDDTRTCYPITVGAPGDFMLQDKPRNEWIQLAVAEFDTSLLSKTEFDTSSLSNKRLVVQLEFETGGVVIKGVLIQPKR